MKNVLILGAGPTGLACAYQLSKYKNYNVTVIEKSDSVGGYGKSFKWNDDILDIGPHAFHTRGGEAEDIIKSLFENDTDELISGEKKVSIYLNNKFFKYPLQVKEALLRFNVLTSFRIIIEFFLTSVFHSIVSIPITNFEEWGKKRFGSKLYQISFGDYTEKVWKLKPSHISEKFASEKIQGFSFLNLIKKLFKFGGHVTEPYYQHWIYSKEGSGDLFERLRNKISESENFDIHFNSKISKIDSQSKKILFDDNKELEYDLLINTIPLPDFVNLTNNIPFSVKYHANKLQYNSLIIVYIKVDISKVSDNTWFYLLDKGIQVNRITEQKNLSESTIAGDYTILSYEYTHREGDEYSQYSDEEIYKIALKDNEMISILADKKELITDYTVKRFENAYEIYDLDFEKNVDVLLSYIHTELNDTVTVGRRGMFLQTDMFTSVELGLEMAKLLNNEPSDTEIMQFYQKYMKFL